MEKLYDIVIIGGGPAGISAGIYSYRAGMKVLVVDGGKSTLDKAAKIQNYYGIENISGAELVQKGINQYINLGGEFLKEQVVNIARDFSTLNFVIKTTLKTIVSKAIILCVGGNSKKTLKELEAFEGTNVSYCAICDGFFYRNAIVAVVGEGEFAVHECKELENVANKVFWLTNGQDVDGSGLKKTTIINTKISEFFGKDKVEVVAFEDGTQLKIDGVFVALGTLSGFNISKQLGLLMNKDCLIVDKNFMTNVAGVFAAGDVVGGLLQVAKAVGDGAQAGLEAARYIKIKEYKENN